MRIDLFLKDSGLVKRRKIAHDLCTNGSVKLNSLPVKPSKAVKNGDLITIATPEKIIKVNVTNVEEGKFQITGK